MSQDNIELIDKGIADCESIIDHLYKTIASLEKIKKLYKPSNVVRLKDD